MGAGDFLCSRNARSQTPLVGRAQWKINQPPSLRDNERVWNEQKRVDSMVSCARATRGLRRPSFGLMARLGVPVGGRVRKFAQWGPSSQPSGEGARLAGRSRVTVRGKFKKRLQ